jgi:hypothetical protein
MLVGGRPGLAVVLATAAGPSNLTLAKGQT